MMRRREFISLFGCAVAAWPVAARAQQAEQMRRIGVLLNAAADDPDGQAGIAAFNQALQQLGWAVGGQLRIDTRWGQNDEDLDRKYAAELVALAPDVVLASGSLSVAALKRVARTVPIVFAGVADPVGGGFVDSLARPGGNITGFLLFEFGLAGKWVNVLKETAPRVTRAAIIRDPKTPAGIGQWAVIEAIAPSVGVELSLINIRDAGELERDIIAFARSSNGGLIVTASPVATQHRELIIRLASDYKLPAVYFERYFVAGGGFVSSGPPLV